MGTETSRRVSDETILALDEFQLHLKRLGVQVSQKELIETSVDVAIEHKNDVMSRLKKKKRSLAEATEDLLKKIKPVNLGKNWLEEIDTTL